MFVSQDSQNNDSVSVGELPDPLLDLAGSGRELWANEHADEYVRRLREEVDPMPQRDR